MNTTSIAIIFFACLVAVVFFGRQVRRYLPADHLSADSKDAVKLAMSLVATMTALLLGLLINSAKGTFETTRSQVIQMTAKVVFVDRVLALYGPETADARTKVRDAVADAVGRIWAEGSSSTQLAPNERMGDAAYVAVQALSPANDIQRALKSQAATLMTDIAQLRSLLQAQAMPSIARPLLVALVCWLVIIFFGFSLVAPPNPTTALALLASAFAVGCAVFLILELDHPLSGPIRIPSEPVINVLNQLAR